MNALFCNQTSYNFEKQKYLFEILAEQGGLKHIFVPEHGLFAEYQDQIPLDSTHIYNFISPEIKIISLYGSSEDSIFIKKENLENIDNLIIDIQDIGSRYYTYISTIANIFKVIKENSIHIKIYVFDRPNPAGKNIEGTPISSEFSSFIGHVGIPHRHGLTIGEMCLFLRNQISANFEIELFNYNISNNQFFIQPSPNIPTLDTINIYSGTCLFEGTNFSEGRGTTKPFEIIGSPNISWSELKTVQKGIKKYYKNNIPIHLRILKFVPTFHKFENQICNGFQLHQTGKEFHSLLFALILLRLLAENSINQEFWREGKYEKGNSKTAIELLAGDQAILDFLKGKNNFKLLKEKIQFSEKQWNIERNSIKKKSFISNPKSLFQK